MDVFGPFEHYSVSSGQIDTAAAVTRRSNTPIRHLAAQVRTEHRRAVEAVTGLLAGPAAAASTHAHGVAEAVSQDAEFAAGCLELFGRAVDDFDYASTSPRSVQKLNTSYTMSARNNFGAVLVDPGPNASAAEREVAIESFASEIRASRVRVERELELEYALLEAKLDEAAKDVSSMLDRGVNTGDVELLWAAGALPAYSPIVFADTNFADLPMPAKTSRELLEFLRSHPGEITDPAYAALNQLPVRDHDELDVAEAVESLRDAGLLDGEPDAYYEEWIRQTLSRGLEPADMVERAEEEHVTMETFDPIRDLDAAVDPDGHSFFYLTEDSDVEEVSRVTELYNGGAPSRSEWRRDLNYAARWNFLDPGFALGHGGAVVSTPEGTTMAMPGPEKWPLDNPLDVCVERGGTTYLEMFIVNGSHDDPEQELRMMIESGSTSPTFDSDDPFAVPTAGGDPLGPLLQHERIHSEQWAIFGLAFPPLYAAVDINGPCNNIFEIMAGLEEGGYDQCLPDDGEAD